MFRLMGLGFFAAGQFAMSMMMCVNRGSSPGAVGV
jgi:hypothetical protein